MDILTIILRLLHIFGGVFWIGAAWLLVTFLEPTAKVSAPEGPKFLQRLFSSQFPTVVSAAAGLNILSGLLLYWRDSGGFQIAWITGRFGLALTVGGVATLVAFGLGFLVSKPAADRMAVIGREIQASGKPPTPEQAAEMQRLSARVSNAAKWVAALLAIALATMAIARYL